MATLIPKEYAANFELLETKSDNSGRFLLLHCKLFNLELAFTNVYCPTKDNPIAQNNVFNFLYDNITNFSDKNIILGGDLNTYLDINLDKKGGKQDKQTKFSET